MCICSLLHFTLWLVRQYVRQPAHHPCTPSLKITRPTSLSLSPSKTPLTNGPTTAGSPAPSFLVASAFPPSPVARKPGEMHHTFTPSGWRVRCHSVFFLGKKKEKEGRGDMCGYENEDALGLAEWGGMEIEMEMDKTHLASSCSSRTWRSGTQGCCSGTSDPSSSASLRRGAC